MNFLFEQTQKRFKLFLILATNFATLSTVSGTFNIHKVVYFPDPKNRGSVLPAIVDGTAPFWSGNDFRHHGHRRDVRFFLITSDSSESPVELRVGDGEALENSNYVKNVPWIIMIHGFGSAYTDNFPWDVAQTYFKLGLPVNIILVDWSDLAASPWYIIAVDNVNYVGDKTADLVRFLVHRNAMSDTLDDLHIIGFSLGAHVAGHAGVALGRNVARITGLDPALPCFEDVSKDKRIDSSDARFVDVVHTAGGYPWDNGLSLLIPCGHVDFYPNNGRSQPGCEGEKFGTCSHERAVLYFQESVLSESGFYGCKCNDWDHFQAGNCDSQDTAIMGYSTPETANGSYYFRTTNETLFALGKRGLRSIKVF